MTSIDKPIEIRARNVEAAIEKGLEELGLSRDKVEIEVLHPGSRGVLGIGAENAIVRLTPQLQPPAVKEERAEEKVVEEAGEAVAEAEEEEPAEVAKAEVVTAAPEAAAEEAGKEEIATLAQNLLSDLLKHLGVEAKVLVHYENAAKGEKPPLMLDVVGKDLGILIGRRGDTLAALQFLTRLMVNRHTQRWINLVVDVEGYKARRERILRELALRMAERAVSTGRVVALEAMPARERRIVHLALQDHPQVTTKSIGEGESRKVTIIPH